MVVLTTTSTFYDVVPGQSGKILLITTPATTLASDTISVAGYMKTITLLIISGADGAAVASGTWSTTTITIPSTAATGAKTLIVFGTD